ncbi:MAG: DsrH/TusB family sulfur metabolism protein [Thermodesulfovibrionia bacterium]
MLFLISSAPDTKEFKTAYKLAKDMNAEICLLQNAVYASRNLNDSSLYVLLDEMKLRGIKEDEISGKPINYDQLIDLMTGMDKVVGLF